MQVFGSFCRRSVFTLGLLFLVSALVSCSGSTGDLYPVKGKVVYKDAPASGVLVTLHPAAGDDPKLQVPTGRTSDDGSFEISTGADLGAPGGQYIATVIWMQEKAGSRKKAPGATSLIPDVQMEDRLKGKYAETKNSPFKSVIVSRGSNELPPMKLQ
jgi:hypothetical protein